MHTAGLEPDEVVHSLRGIGDSITARNYSSLAALVFLILAYLWSITDEVQFIWRLPPYRLSEALYIIARYIPIAIQTMSYIFVQRFLLHFPVSTVHCKVWFSVLGATTDVLSGVMDLILLLRVFALYKKNRSVFFFVLPLIMKHAFAQILLGQIAFGEPSFTDYCDLQHTPLISVPLGIFTLGSHFGLWYATFAKRKVSDTALLSSVVNESHWTFALFAVPTLIAIPWSFHTNPNPFIIFVWPITLISIALCHILLKVSRLKAKIALMARRGPFAASTTDFLFSTILEFEDPAFGLESRASEVSQGPPVGSHGGDGPRPQHGGSLGTGVAMIISPAATHCQDNKSLA